MMLKNIFYIFSCVTILYLSTALCKADKKDQQQLKSFTTNLIEGNEELVIKSFSGRGSDTSSDDHVDSKHLPGHFVDDVEIDEPGNTNDASDTIPEINKDMSKGMLIEGDIKPSLFRNGGDGRSWPKTNSGPFRGLVKVPYTLSNSYSDDERNIILEALETFSAHTCIRFTPKRNEKIGIVIKSEDGCWATVGAPVAGENVVSLASFRCINQGIALHEFMHTLGFFHEHARSDRDDYIKIVEENIKEGEKYNFDKNNDSQNLVVYDYNSVLHYRKTAFSKKPFLPTIIIKTNGGSDPRIGYRQTLSPYDIEEIKYYYNCEPGTYRRCGKDFKNRSKGVFRSPSFPNSYPAKSHCTWNITVNSGKYIEVNFSNIDIEDSTQCQNDVILIHDGVDAGAPLLHKICGKKSFQIVTSTSNNLFIMFSSDSDTYDFNGFTATFRKVSTPGIQPTSPPTVSNSFTAISEVVDEFQCNFDNGFCGMTQDRDDKTNFRLKSGSTSTVNTGPSRDHTSGRGKYALLDSSSAKSGDNAILRTPWLRANTLCITFSYHMYGEKMGGLRVFTVEKQTDSDLVKRSLIWEKYENQGNRWHTTKQNYQPKPNVEYVQLYFEGYAYLKTSDIAVDDVQITNNPCFVPTTTSNVVGIAGTNLKTPRPTAGTKNTPEPSTTVRPAPSRQYTPGMPLCTFEFKRRVRTPISRPWSIPGHSTNDLGAYNYPSSILNDRLCGWLQVRFDNFDWKMNRGRTLTRNTGPAGDHTSGRGYYLYTEATRRSRDNTAYLKTYPMPASDYCMDLNYHMYGQGIGRLIIRTVQVLQDNTRQHPILHEIIGNQGNQWKNIKIDFSALPSAKNVAFQLQGVVGRNSRGDIAVDDIAILPGKCDACKNPTHRINGAQFVTGCAHTGLFWVRCCNDPKQKFVYRRVRECSGDMFPAMRLHWYCRNM